MRILPADLPLVEAEDRLHDIARRMTGLEDFGGDDYLAALRTLLCSYDEDADLTEHGRTMSAGMVIVALVGRLASQAGWAANAAYRDVEINAPLVIVGLPRTGTTALHRLLARDPEHQGLELWLGQTPMPRPPRHEWEEQPAYQSCLSGLEAQRAASPDIESIHEMAADAVDECWNLLRQDFASVTYECAADVHGYARWWADCDMTRAYERWADNLRLIGLNDTPKRWILKDPSHLFAPEALLAQAPDAHFIMTHRDPALSIPSVCSLNSAARAAALRSPDAAALGRDQVELWAHGIDRALRVREARPDRFIDVHFDELVAEPIGVVRRIYERIGATLSPETEQSMKRWLGENRGGGHRYDAAEYGLSPAGIRERFAGYVRRCDVHLED